MKFSFYSADSAYCEFLRKFDPCVPDVSKEKATRPFVGIVFAINGINYYAPLSSPKPKHKYIKDNLDFVKINGGIWGAINLNNMIPIHTKSITKINVGIVPTDSPHEVQYKNLLQNQLSWCNANRTEIENRAKRLYELIVKGYAPAKLAERCCIFTVDELHYAEFCEHNNWI